MKYTVNPAGWSSAFVVPGELVDRYLTLATPDQIRVLLYLACHSEANSPERMAEALSLSLHEAADCLEFWHGTGLLQKDGTASPASAEEKKAGVAAARPTREEVAQLSKNDENLCFLLREVQSRFGRFLRQNETALFAWLYAEEGMDVSVILMLVEYAVRQGKANARFLEKTALEWLEAGVTDLAGAEELLAAKNAASIHQKVLIAAFGIKNRKLSRQEADMAQTFVGEYGFTRDLLEKAYDICVDSTGTYSATYIKGILNRWHASGVKEVADLQKETPVKKSKQPGRYAAYDKSLIRQLIEEDDAP